MNNLPGSFILVAACALAGSANASEVPASPATREYWQQCAANIGVPADQVVRTRRFGETREMTDVLTKLVIEREKTITTTTPWLYEKSPELKPVEGGYSVVVDDALLPRAVIRTTASITLPYRDVTEEYSRHEGASVRPIEAWRQVHWRFFTRELAPVGKVPSEDMPVTLEKFEVVCSG